MSHALHSNNLYRIFTYVKNKEAELKDARARLKFKAFPPHYQRGLAYNVMFYKTRNREQYEKGLQPLIETAAKGEMFGEWNDYGRLLEGETNG